MPSASLCRRAQRTDRFGKTNSIFDCARRKAADQELRKCEIHHNDRHPDKHRSCRETGKLVVAQRHQAHRNGIEVFLFEKKLREDEVAPRPHKGGEQRIDDHGRSERQGDAQKHLRIGRPVYPRCLIDGFWDGIEEAFLRHIPHRRTGGVDQDESPMAVDEVELRHEKIHRRHCHEGGKHPQNERRFHERFAALEPITGHTVCREDGQCRSEQAAHRGNEQRVAEPFRIIIQRRIRKQLLKAVEAVLRREKAVEGIQRARPRKRCQKQPQDGKEEHQTDRQYDDVSDDGIDRMSYLDVLH